MSILRAKTVWHREPRDRPAQPPSMLKLTRAQSDHVKAALRYVARLHGGVNKLALVTGATAHALWKYSGPTRPANSRIAMAVAALLGVDIRDVLSGAWRDEPCPHCHGTGKTKR